jgi:hypothetical protein
LGSRSDVIEHSETAIKYDHPCPKPEKFWKKLLMRVSVVPEEAILDPFMGSGTTLRIAKDLGRKAAGIEIEEAELTMIAKSAVAMEGGDAERLLKLLDALEDDDDIQRVAANFDIDEEILARAS